MSLKSIAAAVLSGLSVLPASLAARESCPAIDGGEPARVRLSGPTIQRIHTPKPEFDELGQFSGLAVVPDGSGGGFSLWTVDDDKHLLIRLSSAAEIVGTVEAPGSEDLEDIAFDAKTGRLAILSEQSGRVQFFQRQDGDAFRKSGEFTLSELSGYDSGDTQDASGNTLKDYYESYTAVEEDKGEEPNSGWEGMTFTGDGRMFFVKEKNPAILIEVRLDDADPARSAITDVIMLNCGSKKKAGLCPKPKSGDLPFPDKVEVDGEDEVLDFSGLAYDAATDKLWMASDTAQAAILFDPKTRTFSAFTLADTSGECLPSPEGIALSAEGKRLFVINDRKRAEGPSSILSYEIAR